MSFLTEIMKRMGANSGLAVGWVICLFCLAVPGYCADSTALMLEVSPVNGGTLNLSPGVHSFDRDAAVTLTAVPKSGYQFVYWVGSVDNATTSTTLVFLDSPKIVIAVFERSKFDLVDLEEPPDISMGSGGLIPSGADYAAGLEQAGGGRRPPGSHGPRPPEPPSDDVPVPEEGDDIPVPEGEDFPVPVPEPATITILLTGMLVLAGRRHRRVNTHL